MTHRVYLVSTCWSISIQAWYLLCSVIMPSHMWGRYHVVSEGSAACPGFVISTHRSLRAATQAGWAKSKPATVLEWNPAGLGSYKDIPRWQALAYASRCKGFRYLGRGEWTIFSGLVESVWGDLTPEQQAQRKQLVAERLAMRRSTYLARAGAARGVPAAPELARELRSGSVRTSRSGGALASVVRYPAVRMLTDEEYERRLKRSRYARHTRRRKDEQLVEEREAAEWQVERARIIAARQVEVAHH